jgi:hypothetical protein
VAARSKPYRLVAGIACSNLAWGMDVCLLCLYVVLSCVGRGLCDGLITRPEESYRVSVCMYVIHKPQYKEGQASSKGWNAIGVTNYAKTTNYEL